MGRINSSIGLITGIPIQETVDKLIAIEARPRDRLVARTEKLQKKQSALADLTSRLLSLQFHVRQLARQDVFDARKAESSNAAIVSLTVEGTPRTGTYRVLPLQVAANHRVVGGAFTAADAPLGAGELTIRRGLRIDEPLPLDSLNGGLGVQLGRIRVFDRAGAVADIDLRGALTIRDVVGAINAAAGVRVRASIEGDRIRLTDLTGQSQSRLRVEEIDPGAAADLGLDGIDVDAAAALGKDLARLGPNLLLANLNDGRGVGFDRLLSDLRVSFRDGSDPLDIDFSKPRGIDAPATAVTIARDSTAAVRFFSRPAGEPFNGVQVRFENDDSIVAGEETAQVRLEPSGKKTLVFKIRQGQTTADHIVAALRRNDELSGDFQAEAVIPRFAAGTTSADDPRARILFQSASAGLADDGLRVRFVDDPAVEAGAEVVRLVDEPNGRVLEFRIDEEGTTPRQIIDALARSEYGDKFSARRLVEDPLPVVRLNTAAGRHGEITWIVRDPTLQAPLEIRFVAEPGLARGDERVEFDEQAGVVTVSIAQGETTADDVIRVVLSDPALHRRFLAVRGEGGNGQGLVEPGSAATPDVRSFVRSTDQATLVLDRGGFVSASDAATFSAGKSQTREPPRTVGELLALINAADPDRLEARISSDGKRLELVDKTQGPQTFRVESLHASTAAEDLGFMGLASGDGLLSGKRILGGLDSVLLSSLDGARGLGALGSLELRDRSGASAVAMLSAAETLGDVVRAIREAGVGIEVGVNALGTGLVIRDTTGAVAANLTIADADPGGTTAARLGIAVDDAVNEVRGTDLRPGSVRRSTLLADYRQGAGVRLGQVFITNSRGATSLIDLEDPAIVTIGDVIDTIHRRSLGVEARINDQSDGLVLVDKAGGGGKLRVRDAEGGHAAFDLGIARPAQTRLIDGVQRSVIDGSAAHVIQWDEGTSLSELVDKINASGVAVAASIAESGSRTAPYQLILESTIPGARGLYSIDDSASGITFRETVRGRDAVLHVQHAPGLSTPRTFISATNEFQDIGQGMRVEMRGTSTEAVTLDVAPNFEPIVNAIKLMVEAYNQVRAKLKEYTTFNAEDVSQSGVLFASGEALRVDADLSRLYSSRHGSGEGPIHSFGSLGVSIAADGTLQFDERKVRGQLADQPDAVKAFFTSEATGAAVRLNGIIEQLVGVGNSVLVGGAQTVGRQVDANVARIVTMNERLARSRTRLLRDFYRMESAIAKLQDQLTAISSFTPLPPLSADSQSKR